MPIYEYSCAACGHAFEEWQKMSDPPVKTCPKCKKKKVEKLISQTAFQLKGGGWYKDLYSSSKPAPSSKDKDSAGGASGGTGDGAAKSSESGGAPASGSGSGGGGGSDSGAAAKKTEGKGDGKDAKKKTTPKKSDSRAA